MLFPLSLIKPFQPLAGIPEIKTIESIHAEEAFEKINDTIRLTNKLIITKSLKPETIATLFKAAMEAAKVHKYRVHIDELSDDDSMYYFTVTFRTSVSSRRYGTAFEYRRYGTPPIIKEW